MIEFLFVRVGFCIGFADTLGNDLGETIRMTGVLAVLALHPRRILEKLTTKSAPHDTVELLFDKFMSILLLDFFFTLSDSAFPAKSDVEASFAPILFGLNFVSNFN